MSGDFYVVWRQEYYVQETEILKFGDFYENWRQIYECLESLYCLETQILCSRNRNMKVWRLLQKLGDNNMDD